MPNDKRISDHSQAYFLGIGGIGMSAIARYFLSIGLPVYGYDKTPSSLTDALITEGAKIQFDDSLETLPKAVAKDMSNTLFIITPAIAKKHPQWVWLQSQPVEILKRSQVLGNIARDGFCIAVAGTHGKTTTSTLIAHLLQTCNVNFTAFLGGISSNYNTNYLRNTTGKNIIDKEIIVLEADEFDRSFHRLNPDLVVVTAIDPDHLDIYGTPEAFTKAFEDFVKLIRPWNKTLNNPNKPSGAALVIHEKLKLLVPNYITTCTYGQSENAQFAGINVHINQGDFCFDFIDNSQINNNSQIKSGSLKIEGSQKIEGFKCGLPGHHNVENALAALGICHGFLGLPIELLKAGISSYQGAKRRFEYIHRSKHFVVIDDYAHHPEELNAIIGSVRTLYPDKKITGIFQPHLYSRTRDFAQAFANSLSSLDNVCLLDIYPARELPIEGVTSTWLMHLIQNPNKILLQKNEVETYIQQNQPEILLILGAGDIDRLVEPIKKQYEELASRVK